MNIELYFLNTLYAFVAVFVAMDVAGGLPIYIALTEGFEGPQKRRVIRQSIITSLAVGIGLLAIVWIVFSQSDRFIRALGEAGSKAFAKVASLLLAAIAVMMIRKGLIELMREAKP